MSDDDTAPANAKADAKAEKARAKAMRPWYKKKRWIIPLAAVVLLFVIIGSSGDGTDPELVDDSGDDEQADRDDSGDDGGGGGSDVEGQVADDTFSVGETVAMGDLEHTLHAVRFSEGGEFSEPDEGERWLVVDVEVTNNSDESQAMSSMIMWRLIDEDNRSRDIAVTGDEQGSMDGELGAGRSMRGDISYSVKEGQSSWELIFEPEVFGFGQAIYEISADDAE